MSYSKEIVDVTLQTLSRLRQIRGWVLENKPTNFDGIPRTTAENLIGGLAGLLSSNCNDVEGGLEKQRLILSDSKLYDDCDQPVVSGTGLGLLLQGLESINRWGADRQNPWQYLMGMNDLSDLGPQDEELVVSPLSSGPLGIALARTLYNPNIRVALAVVDNTKAYDVFVKHKPREVYLPSQTSWPSSEGLGNYGRVFILDNTVNTGLTAGAIRTAIMERWGVEDRKIIGGR